MYYRNESGEWAKLSLDAELTKDVYTDGYLLDIHNIRKGCGLYANGKYREDEAFSQYIYAVNEGASYFVSLSKDDEAVYQWSTNEVGNTNYIVGSPITEAVEGVINVPKGAKYLVVSQLNTNRTNKVAYVANNITEEPECIHLRVGSYNIGHFVEGESHHPMGTEEQKYMFRNTIAELGCNILGLQENDVLFNEETSENSYDAVYSMFKYYSTMQPNIYTCNGFASDYKLCNFKEKYFDTQVSQQRAYYECNIKINGKDIHLICTHLDWKDATGRRKQIDELIERANQFDRVIICGDFNPNNPNDPYEPSVYETDFKKWTDAGYKLANGGYFGWLNTVADREGAEEGVYPWDNIIVSPNIQIKAVGRVVKDYMIDHIPIWADLVIY